MCGLPNMVFSRKNMHIGRAFSSINGADGLCTVLSDNPRRATEILNLMYLCHPAVGFLATQRRVAYSLIKEYMLQVIYTNSKRVHFCICLHLPQLNFSCLLGTDLGERTDGSLDTAADNSCTPTIQALLSVFFYSIRRFALLS